MEVFLKQTKQTKYKKYLKRAIIILATLIVILSTVSLIYLNTGHYKAQSRALEVLNTAQNLTIEDNLYILTPNEQTNTAFIFYPGAKVQASAYLPLMQKITQQIGITTILVEMPFNISFFGINSATDIIKSMPEIKNFYIGGHSLGSASASIYASDNSDAVNGLVVMGGYVYGDYPPEKSLTIYGTFNSELEKFIDYTENIIIIEGGNHAQFGDYGEQKGDPKATITAMQQEDITVDAMQQFINVN